MLEDKEDFSDVILSDECTVQLDNHRHFVFQEGQTTEKVEKPSETSYQGPSGMKFLAMVQLR